MSQQRIAIALAAGLVATVCGCVSTSSVTTYTVRQAGLVPGATAPLIAGTGPDDGKFSLFASWQGGFRGKPTARDSGALGNILGDTGGRAGFAYSGGWWAVALAAEYRPGPLLFSTASDVSKATVGSEGMIYPTMAWRFRPVKTENFELGLIAEASVTDVRYKRAVNTTSDYVDTFWNGQTFSGTTMSQGHSEGEFLTPVFRTGPAFTWRFGKVFSLTAGALVTNAPYIEGTTVVSETCINWNCTGSNDGDVPVVSEAIAIIPFVAPSFAIGDHVQLVGQLFGNISMDYRQMTSAPGGGELQLRVQF